MSFQIKLPQFEGPFDLLLFFIQRDELNIYDIPITTITADFLDYMHTMEVLNMELSADFVLVAATLMRIKTQMLLPEPIAPTGEEPVDPRTVLVAQLEAHQRAKVAADALAILAAARAEQLPRGHVAEWALVREHFALEGIMESVSVGRLATAYQKALERMHKRHRDPHMVDDPPYSVAAEADNLRERLATGKKLTANTLFAHCNGVDQLVCVFLAVLELVAASELDIVVELHEQTAFSVNMRTNATPLNLPEQA